MRRYAKTVIIVLTTLFVLIGLHSNVKAEEIESDATEEIVTLDLNEECLQFGGLPRTRIKQPDYVITEDVNADSIDPDNSGLMNCTNDSESAEGVYSVVNEAISNMDEAVYMSEYQVTQSEVTQVIADVLNDNAGYFYVEGATASLNDNGTVDSVGLSYAEDADAQKQEYMNTVYESISGINPKWNDEEKLFYLHDYLCNHNSYGIPDTGSPYTAYAALVLHKSVCQGYMLAFNDLCYYAGIRSWNVVSYEIDHGWNVVLLNDKYYYVDCTFDDHDSVFYTHFLQSQSESAKSHHCSDWISDYESYGDNKEYDNAEWRDAYGNGLCIDDGIIYNDHRKRCLRIYKCDGATYYDAIDPSEDNVWDMYETDDDGLKIGGPGQIRFVGCVDGVLFNAGDKIFFLNTQKRTYSEIYSIDHKEISESKIYICNLRSEGTTLVFDIGQRQGTFSYGIIGTKRIDMPHEDRSYEMKGVSLDKLMLEFDGISGNGKLTVSGKLPESAKWITSDPKVATVKDGVVTPVGYGRAQVGIICGNIWVSCPVFVNNVWQNEYEDFSVYRDTKHAYLDEYEGGEKSLIVPSLIMYEGFDFSIWYYVLGSNNNVESVVFEDGFRPGSLLLFCDNETVKQIDLSNVDTSNIDCFGSMFLGCNKLEDLNISGMDTSSAYQMEYMFGFCSSLKKLDLSGFDTSKVHNMSGMFSNCTALEELNISGWDTRSVNSISGMFESCDSLRSLDMSSLDLSSLHEYRADDVFKNDNNLSEIYSPLHLAVNVKLPFEFRDDEGNVYTSLPLNQDKSIHLTRVISASEIKGVEITAYPDELSIGESVSLSYNTIPVGGEVNSVLWQSSNDRIAAVDQSGVITGVGAGTAKITLKVNNKHTASVSINVVEKKIPLEDLKPEEELIELNVGDMYVVSVIRVPEDTTDKVTFKSVDRSVATVDSEGNVLAKQAGQTDIVISGGKIEKTCHLIVYDRLKTVFLDSDKVTINNGDTMTLQAGITPNDIPVSFDWVTGNSEIADIAVSKDGVSASVNAKSPGRTLVTVTATDTTRNPIISKTASAVIVVLDSGAVVFEKGFSIQGLDQPYLHAGQKVIPDVTVWYDGIRLIEGKEYTISCTNNKTPGTGYLIVNGKGNFKGKSKKLPYEITAAKTGSVSIKKALVTGIEKEYPFSGKPVVVKDLCVSLNGADLKNGEDYIVSYRNHIDTGNAVMVIEGIGEYNGTITRKFKITPVPVSETQIEELSVNYVSGGAKPVPQITYMDHELKYNVDFKLSWNTNKIGTGNMTVTGLGNFTGRINKDINIKSSDLADMMIAVPDAGYKKNATGASFMSKVNIYDPNGNMLKLGTDYLLKYEDLTKGITLDKTIGKNMIDLHDVVRVTAYPGSNGNFTGKVSAEYLISEAPKRISEVKAGKISPEQYSGEGIRPAVTLGDGLKEGIDYEIIGYFNNVYKGTGKVLIAGKGEYSGARLLNFKIVPRLLNQ